MLSLACSWSRKMKVLSSVQELLVILGVIRSHKSDFKSQCYSFIIKLLIILISSNLCFLSLLFIIDETQEDRDKVFSAIIQITCMMPVLLSYIWLNFISKFTFKSFESIKRIVERRYSNENKNLYENAEKKSDFLVKYPSNISILFYCSAILITKIIYLVRDSMRGDINTLKWFNLHYMR